MSWHRPDFGLCRTLADRDGVLDLPALLSCGGGAPGLSHPPSASQMGKESLFQGASGLDEQGTVDGLMRHVHHSIIRIAPYKPTGDLLR